MRSAAVAAFALLAGSLSLIAQRPVPSVMKLDTARPVVQTSSTCPIGMRVLQGAGNSMVEVKDSKRVETSVGSRLRLQLTNSPHRTSPITAATLTVHGLNGKPGMAPLLATHDGSGEVTKTVNATFTPEDGQSFSAELELPGVIAPSLVELETVSYADGSTWRLAGHEGCQSTPDLLMLVATH